MAPVGNVKPYGANGFEPLVRFGGVKGLEEGDENGEGDLTITARLRRFWDATGIWEINDAVEASDENVSLVFCGFEGLLTSGEGVGVEGRVGIERLWTLKGST